MKIVASLLILLQGAHGSSSIECSGPSTALVEETRVCTATFSIDDLQGAPSVLFKGFDGQDEALFIKTESIVQNLDDGTQEVTWFGSFVTEEGSYGGSAALYQTSDRLEELIGTFTTLTSGYKIKPMFNGEMRIEATPLPTEAPPVPNCTKMRSDHYRGLLIPERNKRSSKIVTSNIGNDNERQRNALPR